MRVERKILKWFERMGLERLTAEACQSLVEGERSRSRPSCRWFGWTQKAVKCDFDGTATCKSYMFR